MCSDCESYGLKKHGLTRYDCTLNNNRPTWYIKFQRRVIIINTSCLISKHVSSIGCKWWWFKMLNSDLKYIKLVGVIHPCCLTMPMATRMSCTTSV